MLSNQESVHPLLIKYGHQLQRNQLRCDKNEGHFNLKLGPLERTSA